MKIAGCTIFNKFIEENTEKQFTATYKGSRICITTDHGHGMPKEKHLKRYDIDVRAKSGQLEVNTWQDLHTMADAIKYALKGSCLIPEN